MKHIKDEVVIIMTMITQLQKINYNEYVPKEVMLAIDELVKIYSDDTIHTKHQTLKGYATVVNNEIILEKHPEFIPFDEFICSIHFSRFLSSHHLSTKTRAYSDVKYSVNKHVKRLLVYFGKKEPSFESIIRFILKDILSDLIKK